MEEKREPMLVVAVGFMGAGKTYTTSETVEDYIRDGAGGRKGRPVLAFDPNVEDSYQNYKPIDFDITIDDEYSRGEQIRNIRAPGRYRILPYKKNRQPMTTTEMVKTTMTICKFYRGGLLVLEDINKYTAWTYKQDVIGMLMGLRHLDVDLILHFQNLRFLPTRVWPNMTYLRWHKQSDPISKYKNRISNYELYAIAEEIVNINYVRNKYFYLWLNNLRECFEGIGFEQFREGATAYLRKNPAVLKRIMQEIDENGKKKYSDMNQAMSGFINDTSEKYLRQ